MFDDSDFVELDVDNAMENVEGDAETQGRNTTRVSTASASVTIASVSISTAKPRTVFEDEDLTIAQTLVKMRSEKAKEKGVALRDVDEFARPTRILLTIDLKDKGKGIMQEPKKPPKNLRKAQIQMDEELAQRLFEEEQAQFEREQRIAREKAIEQEAKDDVLITQMEYIQARMDADELLAERLQQEKREQFTIEEKSRMLVEMIAEKKSSKKRQRIDLDDENVKRQKTGEASGSGEEQSTEKEKELSEEELQKLLVIVPVEEVYVEALQVKYPIIDWEVYSEDARRDDLVKLWDLVKERFSTTEPIDDKEKELWVELQRLFEPDSNDTLWKLQRERLSIIKRSSDVDVG
ncbi:hypothetical protein Tco_1422556 [Tanacetum coccineum]